MRLSNSRKRAGAPEGGLDIRHDDSREWRAKLVDKDDDLLRDHHLFVNLVDNLGVITLDEVV